MADKTIIDRQAINSAITLAGASLYENFQPHGDDQTCFAVTCESDQMYTQFMIEVAALDAALATNLNDVVRDVGIGNGKVFFFTGFDLEEVEEGHDGRTDAEREASSRGLSAL